MGDGLLLQHEAHIEALLFYILHPCPLRRQAAWCDDATRRVDSVHQYRDRSTTAGRVGRQYAVQLRWLGSHANGRKTSATRPQAPFCGAPPCRCDDGFVPPNVVAVSQSQLDVVILAYIPVFKRCHWIGGNLERSGNYPTLTQNEQLFRKAILSGNIVNHYHHTWVDSEGEQRWGR